MEQNGEKGCDDNQVPRLDDIEVSIVTGLKGASDAVQNVSRQSGTQNLLKFKNEIAS